MNDAPLNNGILKALINGLAAIELDGYDEEGNIIGPIWTNFKMIVNESKALNIEHWTLNIEHWTLNIRANIGKYDLVTKVRRKVVVRNKETTRQKVQVAKHGNAVLEMVGPK